MHYTRLLFLTLLSCLQLALFAQIDMQAHVASDEGKKAYTTYTTKQTAYYTGTYTYASLIDLKNDALFGRLNTLMGNTAFTTGRTFNYSNLSTNYGPVDTDLNNKNNIILFYNGASVSSKWDNGSRDTFNKEHVWPKSIGAQEGDRMGHDMHAVRPCNPDINSTRGNRGYAEIDNANTYVPNTSYRGDCARIIMYDHITYGKQGTTLYEERGIADLFNQFGTNSGDIFESLRIMLKWHMQDPPSLTEMVRNDGAQDYQGNRNPLIDYPELAIQVFLDDGITTYTVTESSAATMWPAHRYTLSDGFIAYLTNSDGTHPAESDFEVTGATYTYNASLGRLTVSEVTGNMTISDVAGSTPDPDPDPEPDPATYTVTWMANGAVYRTAPYNANGTQTISVPAAPVACDGYTFVGWTTEANYSNPFCAPEDLLTSDTQQKPKVTSNLTYYAVFKKD